MQPKDYEKYERAKKRVKQIKGFYGHLRLYILINLMILIGRYLVLEYLIDPSVQTEDFNNWLNWNTYISPILWGIALTIHGLVVFSNHFPIFNKNWEEKKIRELMKEEEQNRTRWQ